VIPLWLYNLHSTHSSPLSVDLPYLYTNKCIP
jgi:hypothetical protein